MPSSHLSSEPRFRVHLSLLSGPPKVDTDTQSSEVLSPVNHDVLSRTALLLHPFRARRCPKGAQRQPSDLSPLEEAKKAEPSHEGEEAQRGFRGSVLRIEAVDRVLSREDVTSREASMASAEASTSASTVSAGASAQGQHTPPRNVPAPFSVAELCSPHPSSSPPASPRTVAEKSGPLARWEWQGSFGGEDKEAKRRVLGANAKGDSTRALEIRGSEEVAFGLVHLFRPQSSSESGLLNANGPGTPTRMTNAGASDLAKEDAPSTTVLTDDNEEDAGTILAVLGVPAYMHAADFLAFVEAAVEVFEHVRILRESSPGRCLILIKFRDALDAEFFYKEFNGAPFNAMHPNDLCRVVYVTAVTISAGFGQPMLALANTDPWPLPIRRPAGASEYSEYELPTCPVCLDRMDSSVTGLMTVTCQHSFHCACLGRWEDSRCPVCRYTQSRRRGAAGQRGSAAMAHSSLRPDEEEEEGAEQSACASCGTQDDLWVCLICAAVGCGRYKGGHAHSHFDSTAHAYSLELETQRVWSYVEDAYVHRLIQSKADGKLVELPSVRGSQAGASAQVYGTHAGNERLEMSSRRDENEKMEAMGAEFSMLLTSQLDTQRSYYEDQLRGVQSKLSDALSALDNAHLSAGETSTQSATLHTRIAGLEKELDASRSSASKSETRMQKAIEMARKLEKDFQAEKSVGEGLMRRLEKSRAVEDRLGHDVEELKKQNADLQDQMRDLMFFVSARDKIAAEESNGNAESSSRHEAAGGDITGIAEPKKAKAKKKKKKAARNNVNANPGPLEEDATIHASSAARQGEESEE
ncbi:hypothetical protein IE81DRAFT_364964 [Ceraceosorus guamensis]|uniref:Zf-UBP-domain-containing protein n=1 Tax=Ceraceosorus guamensis TaxID=1522189 RepID=A0A316W8T9_9BASI|nr:hypothetical protein IE81DRAFT_364964 [Ceraceosorus guamensis]PWN44453.1 hypothetical protein IE81DRAFT_364964 [Ceraceosorus guamensis]